jgi:predicted AlkP superfamily pyrophosphatase or phosphodiesterase
MKPRARRAWSLFVRVAVAAMVAALAGLATAGRLAAEDAPLLILVSFDGFRWDYLQKAPAPNLQALAVRGVKAEGLIPSFPAKTFPNHYTIVTGLYPGRHGIVGNNIRDAGTGRTFALSKAAELRDPMWWGGEPIWVTAERAGVRTGTMFWPGSEAPILGVRPTHWRAYQQSLRGAARVDQVLAWLDQPASRRPGFVTLYFEDTDAAGHDAGPDSEDVRRAITRLDGHLGRLMRGLERRKLADRANIVVLSDHGMAATIPGRVLKLSDYISLADVEIVDINPNLGVFPKAGREQAVYQALVKASPALRMYRRAETPAAWHYRDHARIPPLVGVVDEGWELVRGTLTDRVVDAVVPARGSHGYDPSLESMRGIFVAAGPAFRSGATMPAFENVHIYNALAAALGITPASNDGDLRMAKRMLR